MFLEIQFDFSDRSNLEDNLRINMENAPEVLLNTVSPLENSGLPPDNFVRKILTVIGIIALSALILLLLWQGVEILLLVFAGFCWRFFSKV